jgi:hypothetical protein
VIAGLFPKIGRYVSEISNLLEGLLLLIPFVLVFVLYTFISQLHNFINYLWFLFTPERNVCGLFVESYFINDEPRLALLVVCLRWALLMGHASWPKNDSRPAPPPWRRWLDQPIALEKAEGLAWRVQ